MCVKEHVDEQVAVECARTRARACVCVGAGEVSVSCFVAVCVACWRNGTREAIEMLAV